MTNLTPDRTFPAAAKYQRRVLIISAEPIPEPLAHALTNAHWNIHLVASAREASEHLTTERYTVALALLQKIDDSELIKLEDLLSRHETYWFAIVPATIRDNEHFRRQVLRQLYDFHTEPANVQALVGNIGHAHGMAMMLPEADSKTLYDDARHSMVGASPAMSAHFRALNKASRVNATVLMSGESGTGKQLGAMIVHHLSNRSQERFISVNCTNNEIITAQNLFGSENTASNVREVKTGGIEAAARGTLFLAHVDQLTITLQQRLVDFIETNKFLRDGGQSPVSANPRIIASTTENLEQLVEQGRFREDLFYLLKVIHLETPTLRSRIGDMELLAEYFFKKYSRERNSRVRGFSNQALLALHRYHWPGNVRELENRVRQAVALCETTLIQPRDLALHEISAPEDILSLEEARIRAEGEYIRTALYRNFHNVTETAQQLGVSRVTLYRLMKKYHIDIETERQSSVY